MKILITSLTALFFMGCAHPSHQNLKNVSNDAKVEILSWDVVEEKDNSVNSDKQTSPDANDMYVLDDSIEPCYNWIPADALSAEYMKKIDKVD
tara:strand:+ start:245 stop:523 length:279 start_codon:yes stop_codon:yes gene_type:complete